MGVEINKPASGIENHSCLGGNYTLLDGNDEPLWNISEARHYIDPADNSIKFVFHSSTRLDMLYYIHTVAPGMLQQITLSSI